MTRLIRGADCHWAIGDGFVARLPARLTDETRQEVARLADRAAEAPANAGIFHLTVLVTTRCNLACAYCFQNTAVPDSTAGIPSRIPGASLDGDVVADIKEFTRRAMAENGATRLALVLFGGEPTMYVDHCVRLLRACRDLGLGQAAMISNGTLLDASAARTLEEAGLGSVQISFDGDARAHDRSRVTLGGRGTYERILRNLEEASAATGLRWQLRIQLTGESVGRAGDLLDQLADRLDASRCTVDLALVQDTGIGFSGTDVLRETDELARHVGALYTHALERGFDLPRPKVGACATCGEIGGRTGAVVNSDGVLYSCWESAGRKDMEVGDLVDGYLPREVIAPRWVTCGSVNQLTDSRVEQARRRYEDTVDAIILDGLYARGLLSSGAPRSAAWTRG